MQRDRDATFEVFHKVDFLCAQLLTAVVGCQSRIKVKLHEVLFLYHLITISSEGFTPPDPSEGFGIHTSTDQAINISSVLQRRFAMFAVRIENEGMSNGRPALGKMQVLHH